QQVLTRHACALRRLVVVRAELVLEQAVVAARLLLLAQLQQVLGLLDPAAAVLARRIRAALDRALLREAALALQEQLHALAAALLALRGTVAGHLDTPPLPLTDAVMGLRRHVLHAEDLEPGSLQRANRRLTARARALDEHLDLLQPVLHALPRARVGGDLRGERRRLARALEAGAAGGLPRNDIAVLVGERDDRVVERRLDVGLPDGDVLAHAAARAAAGRCLPRRGHLGLRRRLLAAAGGLCRAFAGTGVGAGALAVHREPAAVADPAVRADLLQALDRLRALTAQVALHLEVLVDVLAQLRDLVVGEVADLRVRVEAERGRDLARRRLADPVDVRQPDLEPLLVREIDSGNSCQLVLLPVMLSSLRVASTKPEADAHCWEEHYPCLCLCRGLVQMTMVLPCRLITRQRSHMGLTDALTFI